MPVAAAPAAEGAAASTAWPVAPAASLAAQFVGLGQLVSPTCPENTPAPWMQEHRERPAQQPFPCKPVQS